MRYIILSSPWLHAICAPGVISGLHIGIIHDYHMLTVNHSVELVAPSGTHTQNSESYILEQS